MANESVIARYVRVRDELVEHLKVGAPPEFTSVKVPDWFIDVGVGGGCEAQVLSQLWPWVNLLGVEPHPELHRLSSADWGDAFFNAETSARRLLLPVGAWSTPCDRTLHCCVDNPKQSSVYGPQRNEDTKLEIVCRPVDQLCELWQIVPQAAVLWVDVEGAELEVLRGCWRLFNEKRVIACNLEVRERPRWGEACSRAQVDAFMAAFGFVAVTEYNSHWHPDPHCDVIYLRNDQPRIWL